MKAEHGEQAVEESSLAASIEEWAAPFDEWVDRAFDNLRGNSAADRFFYAASELADFSLLWHLVGVARALRSDHHLAEAVRLSVVLGAESAIVNGGIKSLFGRRRPRHEHPRPHNLRQPLTSSFPSGHASAAFVAATLLSDGRPLAAPLYYGAALLVASSRIYVRIHHASDVVVGIGVGLALGRFARRAWPAPGRHS